MNRETVLLQIMPHARRAARRLYFRYDIDQDDAFQQIMLECWEQLLGDFAPTNPVGALQKRVRFAAGHVVQNRFWRRGNGVTDQLREDFEVAAPAKDHDAAIDAARVLARQPIAAKTAFMLRYVAGVDTKDVATAMGLSASGVAHHSNIALKALGVDQRRRPRRDTSSYVFLNDDGREARGNRSDIILVVGHAGAVSDLIGGKKAHYRGWRLAS